MGLRGRLVAALAIVSAVTLAVVAVTLLPPLEQRLRNDEVETLVQGMRSDRGAIGVLPRSAIHVGSPELHDAARTLRRRTGADIAIVAPDGTVLAATDADHAPRFPDGVRAIETGKIKQSVREIGDVHVAHVAVPVDAHGGRFAFVARKLLDNAGDAARVVQRAFAVAAAIGLSVALLLGLLLARRLVRRLRALRDTALTVADLGPVPDVIADRTRDEVGDLTRALATMQERLREQEQARRAFVATASHELRTPLSSMQVMLDMLCDDLERTPPDVAGARDQARRVDDQAGRLAALATDLLDLSRIDAGLPLRREPVEVVEVVRSVAAEFELRAAEAGRRVELDLPGGAWATADPSSVAQIVRILADNALRHAPPGTAMTLAVERGPSAGAAPSRDAAAAAGGGVAIVVRDQGPGVAPADAERIFERFERGAQSSRAPGFGLGLAIGRELAQRMGGTLTLDPPASGGASFRLSLPSDTAGDAPADVPGRTVSRSAS